jgi:hypothetical protein
VNEIVLATLGQLYAHRHGIGGYCLVCQRLFDVSLPALIAERGGDTLVARMKPLTCPGCGGKRTQFNIITPKDRGG